MERRSRQARGNRRLDVLNGYEILVRAIEGASGDIDIAGAINGEGAEPIITVAGAVVAGDPNLIAIGVILHGCVIGVGEADVCVPADINAPEVVHRECGGFVIIVARAIVSSHPELVAVRAVLDGEEVAARRILWF